MSDENVIRCPDCDDAESGMPRRDFLKRVGAVATTAAGCGLWPASAKAASKPDSKAETAVKALYQTLSDEQKKVMCFDWDYQDPKRGLLRSYVSANWHITEPARGFYTQKQRFDLKSFKACSIRNGTSDSSNSCRMTPTERNGGPEHRHLRQAGRSLGLS
jgi:hypothetical protein